MDAFFDWLKQTRLTHHGRTLATKALGYALNQEQSCVACLPMPPAARQHAG